MFSRVRQLQYSAPRTGATDRVTWPAAAGGRQEVEAARQPTHELRVGVRPPHFRNGASFPHRSRRPGARSDIVNALTARCRQRRRRRVRDQAQREFPQQL
jgi:hypothetical protein